MAPLPSRQDDSHQIRGGNGVWLEHLPSDQAALTDRVASQVPGEKLRRTCLLVHLHSIAIRDKETRKKKNKTSRL